MINIYCQYSIGGFKVLNLNAFPHKMSEGRYVFINEIQEGLNGAEQNYFVTRNNDCGLDSRVMRLFSMRSVSLLLLHHAGPKADETILFLDDLQTKTAFAFCAKEDVDINILLRIAATWNSDKKGELVRRLQSLVCLSSIDATQTFVFNECRWSGLIEDLKSTNISLGIVRNVLSSNKNLLIYLTPNKSDILAQARIQLPLSSFITISGNEETKMIEQRNRIITYVATGIALTTLIGAIIYLINK